MLQVTLDAIARVHGDGDLPEIPVLLTKAKKAEASYWRSGPKALKIQVNQSFANSQSNFAHEIGHFLDHQTMGGGGRFASEHNRQLMKDFIEAAENSRAIKNLREMLARKPSLQDRTSAPVPRVWITYALQEREIWARAYAQYISLRSGNAEMMRQIASVRDS